MICSWLNAISVLLLFDHTQVISKTMIGFVTWLVKGGQVIKPISCENNLLINNKVLAHCN